jgi:hypothetical protein
VVAEKGRKTLIITELAQIRRTTATKISIGDIA